MAVAVVVMGILAISKGFCAYASPSTTCKTVQKGNTHADPVVLKEVPLRAPTRDWDLRIPQECPNGSVVGVHVMVCDPSAPPSPTLSILNAGGVLVQRNAYPVVGTAIVYTTLYCDYLRNGTPNLRSLRM